MTPPHPAPRTPDAPAVQAAPARRRTRPGPPPAACGVLHVVATPIGNLEDVTLRALRVLRECDLVVAEDTRRTRRLLSAHGIEARLASLPAFDEPRRIPALLERLAAGQSLALCCDGGTPTISDPGASLVRRAREAGHPVVAVPGPSALTAALSVSGIGGGFCFLGFLPRAPGKLARTLGEALAQGRSLAFFESPLRLARTLRVASEVLGPREVLVARELTKLHEELHVGTAAQLAERFGAVPPRGECTVLVAA